MSCEIQSVSLSVMYVTVYISQRIHHAQPYSLYFTTHTLRSVLQFIFQSLSVMCELKNINCKPERDV
jgi:hypothetical protein